MARHGVQLVQRAQPTPARAAHSSPLQPARCSRVPQTPLRCSGIQLAASNPQAPLMAALPTGCTVTPARSLLVHSPAAVQRQNAP